MGLTRRGDDQVETPDIEQQQDEPGYWENPQTLSMHYQFLNNGVDYPLSLIHI